MDRWIKASRHTDQSPKSIVPRRGASELSQSAVPNAPRRHGRAASPSCISEPRAAAQLRRRRGDCRSDVSGLVDGGSSEVRSAVRKNAVPFRNATRRTCGATPAPGKPAGRSGALGVRGAVVPAQQSCVRLTREIQNTRAATARACA